MLLPNFHYFAPANLGEALSLLGEYNQEAKIFAGGTDLIPKMKLRRLVPKYLINIKKIIAMNYIHYDEKRGLTIGALTSIQAIRDSKTVVKKFGALGEAAGLVATTQIRNIGTIGGNLCNASPASDLAPTLMVLDAKARVISTNGERLVEIGNFFTGPGKTVLKPDEILVELQIPVPPPGSGGTYLKHSVRRADVAIAGVAVQMTLTDDVVSYIRIVLGAVAETPIRAVETEKALLGRKLNTDLLAEVSEIAAKESRPIDDIRARGEYRRSMIRVMIQQALMKAYGQVLGKGGVIVARN